MSDVVIAAGSNPANAGARSTAVSNRAGLLRAPATTDFLMGVALAAIWLIGHMDLGIIHDGRIYMGRALADLHPDGVGRDILFTMDGQSSFSIYRPIASHLAAVFGIGATTGLLILANAAIWFAAIVYLVRSVVPERRAFGLVLAAVIVLPHGYAAWNTLHTAEALAVPRPLAEAGVLVAIALLAQRRYALCLLSLCVAAAFHPIMAMPGFGVMFVDLARRDRRWIVLPAIALVVVGIVALANGPFAARLGASVDPVWRQVLVDRNPYLFLRLWPIGPLVNHLIVWGITIGLACGSLAPRVRFLVLSAFAIALAGVVASFVLGDLASNVLALQVQMWRSLWLPSVLATVAFGVCLWQLPRQGRHGVLAASLLTLAWINLDLFPIATLAAAAAFGALIAETRFDVKIDGAGFRLAHAACGLAILLSFWVPVEAVLAILALGGPLTPGWAAFWGMHIPILPVLAFVLVCSHKPERLSVRGAAAAVALLGLGLVIFAWDCRPPAQASVESETQSRDLTAILATRPGDILWVGSSDVWFRAGRANWNDSVQGAASVFSRDLAVTWYRRSEAVIAAGLATQNLLQPWHAPTPLRGPTLVPSKIASFCRAADAPSWIVVPLDQTASVPSALDARIWANPVPQCILAIQDNAIALRSIDRYAVIPCSAQPSASHG